MRQRRRTSNSRQHQAAQSSPRSPSAGSCGPAAVRPESHADCAHNRGIIRTCFTAKISIMQQQYNPQVIEREAQTALGDTQALPRRREAAQAQVLLPVDVPLPVRQAAHGARAQLHHRRRAHALPPHARLQRAAADGLGRLRPAGRERGDGQRRAAGEVDLRQHRLHEASSSSRWASPSTGSASSPPASPSTTAGTSGCSCACWRRASPTRRPAS